MWRAVKQHACNMMKFAVTALIAMMVVLMMAVSAGAEEIYTDSSGPRIVADKTQLAAGESTTFHVEFYTEEAVASQYDNLSAADPIQTVSWWSSDPYVASVSDQNVADVKTSTAVMGLRDGEAAITAMVVLNDGSVYELKENVTVSGLNYVSSNTNTNDSTYDIAEDEEVPINVIDSGPTLTAEKTKINIGSSTTLTAEYNVSFGISADTGEEIPPITSVSWVSSDDEIAAVSEQNYDSSKVTAIVTGVNSGTATISADITAADGQTYELKQKIKVTEAGSASDNDSNLPIIQLTAGKKKISVGDSTTFKVIYNGSDSDDGDDGEGKSADAIDSVTWSSSDESVATVEQKSAKNKKVTGTVTGISSGKAAITAMVTLGDGQTFQLTQNINVKEAVLNNDTEPSMSASDALIAIGGSTTFKVQFNANVTDSNGKETNPIKSVSWASSDDNIAIVEEEKSSANKVTATVTGVNAGTTIITAAVVTGNDRTYKLTQEITVSRYNLVYEKPSYEGRTVHLSGNYVGSTASFSLEHDSGESIYWAVSDPSIAQMNVKAGDTADKGTLKFKQAGTVILQAKSNLTGDIVASKEIEVKAYVKDIVFQSGSEQRVIVGDTLLVRYSVTDAKDREVKNVPDQVGLVAESSDKTVAKVKSCEKGEMEIIALRAGTATIVLAANDGSGVYAEINVTVVANGDASAVTSLN